MRDYVTVSLFKMPLTHPWVAQVTGEDVMYKFARSFLKPDRTELTPDHMEGGMEWYIIKPGLYQYGGTGEPFCSFLVLSHNKSLRPMVVSAGRAKAIAHLLHSGMTFEAAYQENLRVSEGK